MRRFIDYLKACVWIPKENFITWVLCRKGYDFNNLFWSDLNRITVENYNCDCSGLGLIDILDVLRLERYGS